MYDKLVIKFKPFKDISNILFNEKNKIPGIIKYIDCVKYSRVNIFSKTGAIKYKIVKSIELNSVDNNNAEIINLDTSTKFFP